MINDFNPQIEIKQFLLSRKDEVISKRPSIQYLEAYADKLLEIINRWKAQSNEAILPLILIVREISIFKSDLTGELEHDYEKENKRYRQKWLTQKEKIDSIKRKLITAYENRTNEMLK